LLLSDTTGLTARLVAGSTVGVGFSREFTTPMAIAEYRQRGERIVIRFQGVDTPEAASALIDKAVYVRSADVGVTPANRFDIGSIEGCQAIDRQGALLGTVTEVWLLPANDVWVITMPSGSTIPLPVLDHTVLEVDVQARRITVDVPDGLIDIDKPQPGEQHDT